MKQGRASKEGHYGGKVEPSSRRVSEPAVAQLGIMKGNHATGVGSLPNQREPLYPGRGYEAPMAGSSVHKSGSQGRHK